MRTITWVFLALMSCPSFAASERPWFEPRRIAADESPRIDGDLSDIVWRNAEPIGSFFQVEPREGAVPSEATIAKVVYDENHLYIAVESFDSLPSGIVRTAMGRDANIRDDDHIMLLLDPFGSQRDGYAFAINPLGSRWDALIENNARTLDTWDGIWSGAARMRVDGWTAEFRIPFRSVSWTAAGTDWGFQIVRVIQRNKEQIRWSSISQSIPAEHLSGTGLMRGIRDVERGRGFDAQGFVTAGWRDDPGIAEQSTVEPGANLYYRFTPSLTGTATINPDFSDTQLDERRVNTGRFALFFPETRDFFLQDAAVFEFGGRPLSADPNGLPFFSRQIGISGSEIVDLDFGAKLSGRAGRTSVGVLTARTDQTLSAVRVAVDALGESKAGLILTNGDPLGLGDNTVAGADFQYRNSQLFGNRTLQADIFYARSDSEIHGADDSWGVEVAYPNDRHLWNAAAKEIGSDYAPALGFVNRPGIRSYVANYRFRERPDAGPLRWWQLETWNELVTDLGSDVETRVNGATGWIRTNAGDEAFLESWQTFEGLAEGFNLPDGVRVPAGRYTFTRVNGSIRGSRSRRVAASIGGSCCDFFDGTSRTLSASIFLRPNRYMGLDLSHRTEDIELPTGEVTIAIHALGGSVNFTPDMRLALQAQYDNISERLAMSARWRWEIIPGSEVLVAVGQNALEGSQTDRERANEASVRFAHTLRY